MLSGALEVALTHGGIEVSNAYITEDNAEYFVMDSSNKVFKISPNMSAGSFQEATLSYVASQQNYALTGVGRVEAENGDNNGDNGGGVA